MSVIELDDSALGSDESMQFTYDAYAALLDALGERGYEFTSYGESVEDGDVLLRHDVDWSPERALTMAELEAERGVSATYFFLLTSPFYNCLHRPNREILDRIASLGHEVGLHFSTHQHWSSEPEDRELTAAVAREREILSTVVDDPVDTVSFHIPPNWVLRRSYDEFPSTYEERFFTSIGYRADSNQRWRSSHPFAEGVPTRLQLLVHPGLWAEDDQTFAERLYRERDERFDAIREFLDFQFVEEGIDRT